MSYSFRQNSTIFITPGGQCSSLVAHWLLVLGDHGSNPGGGEKIGLSNIKAGHKINGAKKTL